MSISSSNCLNRNVRGIKRFREKKITVLLVNGFRILLEIFSNAKLGDRLKLI